jgi:hypothetical protein
MGEGGGDEGEREEKVARQQQRLRHRDSEGGDHGGGFWLDRDEETMGGRGDRRGPSTARARRS